MSKLSKFIDENVTHSSARRNAENQAMQAAAEQISFYQTQKDELHKENERITAAKEKERKSIAEKQIRALKRHYRAPGFMENPQATSTDAGASTLG